MPCATIRPALGSPSGTSFVMIDNCTSFAFATLCAVACNNPVKLGTVTVGAGPVTVSSTGIARGTALPEEQARQNDELASKYGIQGFPTIVFADHTGKELGTIGYEEGGPQSWIPKAEASWKKS